MRKQDIEALKEARKALDVEDGMALMTAKVLIDQILQREAMHQAKVQIRDKDKVSFDYDKGQWLNITDAVLKRWKGLFPALCIEIELLRAAGWLLASKKHRKTNHVVFLQCTWFARDQDKGGRDYSPWLQESQNPEKYLDALRAWCKGEREMPNSVERERVRAWRASHGKSSGPGRDPMDAIPPVDELEG